MQRLNCDRLLSTSYRRRQVLIGAGGLTGLVIASQWPKKVLAQPKFSNYPFSLGVASGEPLPDNVVLWTRLAPDPLNGGGMPAYNIPVQWQIATDEIRTLHSTLECNCSTACVYSARLDSRARDCL